MDGPRARTPSTAAALSYGRTVGLLLCRRACTRVERSHPFLQRRDLSADEPAVFRSPASGELHLIVANHVVHDRAIFPGAGYLEMARAAAGSELLLRSVFFVKPLAAEAPGLLVECVVSNGHFEVRSNES